MNKPAINRLLLIGALFLAACSRPALHADRESVPADGASLIRLTTPAAIREGSRYFRSESPTTLRATILPGAATVSDGATTLTLTTVPVYTDSAHDGTPDFLRLDNPADQSAFRRWFTFLAEAPLFEKNLPRDITDCSALIRYAYRHALALHDDAETRANPLPLVPSAPSIEKYNYPRTPLGPAIFRIQPGPFTSADVSNGAFAQFADAQTLIRYNTHFISKDSRRAEPGDILWFRQLAQRMPFHTMVFIGASQLDGTPGPYVVYHTGPHGQMRRLTMQELAHHPDPQWRPNPENSNFLGVYRWNIL